MELLTVPEAARKVSCGEAKIRKALKAGTLPATRFGNYWLIEPADLARWADENGLRFGQEETVSRILARQPTAEAPKVDLAGIFAKREGRL